MSHAPPSAVLCCAVQVLDPVQYPHLGFSLLGLVAETLLVACFCLAFLVLKEMLVLNRCNQAWLSVFIFPLYFVLPIDQCM